jgi:rhamnulose-1-phosphate aldolase/alcohol dehydrogenase
MKHALPRPIANEWNEAFAADLSPVDRLVYRSNLVGSDRRVVNWAGGNTSSKLEHIDHAHRRIAALYVKGSGSDLATIGRDGFAALRLDDLLLLEERDEMADAEMVDYLLRAGLNPGQPRPSIETLLHAFVPAPHVDHTHPDAIIALTAAPGGRGLADHAFADEAVWIDYMRPGFRLAKDVAAAIRANPSSRFVLLAKHGLVTWGSTDEEAYHATLEAVSRAGRALEDSARKPPFGQLRQPPRPNRRRELLLAVLPVLRGALARQRHHVLRVDTTDGVVEYVSGSDTERLSQVGAACPDHLINTKAKPLYVEWDGDTVESLLEGLRAAVPRYEAWYGSYYEDNVDDETRAFAMDPPGPRVVLIPGLGMVTAGTDATRAEISAQLYHRAIEVIRQAAAVSDFTSLNEAEAFAVEYWPLERYKLSLAPPPRELEGRVAVVTGAASGIGRAVAELFASQGAHVAIADIAGDRADEVAASLVQRHGAGRAIALAMDVTDERAVQRAFEEVVLTWGGVDIVVSNAGLALAADLVDTTIEAWKQNFNVLGLGYFLVVREAIRLLQRQDSGGSLIFVASKNALVAGKGAAAYSAAKATELHLARCVAEEVGGNSIRVNVVNPDAVIRGSGIWSSAWKEERARGYGIEPEQLDEHYRQRTTLKVNVFPEDVAEAILWFASDRSSKTTGNILNVDGGVASAYPR